MAEAMEITAAPPSTGSLFHRRIEFLPAKKQFTGFSKGGGGGFRLETLNPTTMDQTKQLVAGSGIGREVAVGKRADVAEVTELGLDPEFSFGFTMKRIGAGLENLGNTCFLNSVLQCLTYTEPLAAYLQSGRHKISCRKSGFCALCAIQNHVGRARQATGRSLAPKDLVSNLRCISRNFRNSRQEDAHEYMVNLLESMHKCCLPSGVPSESPSAFEKSLVHKIFGGRLRSQVKCTQCSFCSDKFDPFVDLSLEINKADSLQKALAHFTAKEYLDGGAKEYQCQKCKQKVKALKQLSIHKAPNVLNIHLKRFGCHQPGQKIDKKVQFGTTLDLKPFVTGAYDGDLKYTLYGVLVHYGGSTRSGHYYCFVRTAGGTWYSLDDHRVGNVSEKRVLQEKAYMLFYVRDRKIVTPKKPLDVGHAQSIINAMGNKMQSNSIQVPKASFQNGPADKRMDSLHPSPALAQIDVAVTSALKESLAKGKGTEETVGARSSVEQEVQLNKSSVMATAKDDGKGISKESAGGLGDVSFGATSNKINKCSGARNTNENPSDLVVVSPNGNCLQNSVKSEVANTPKNNPKEVDKNMSSSLANGNHSSCVDSSIKDNISLKNCDKKGTETVNPSSQVEEQSHVNIQVGGSSKESINGDCSKEVKLTSLESACVPKRKLKKSQITRTRFGSGVLLRAALSSRKKIKKKAKRSALKNNILAQEHLGPSTSELAKPVPVTVNSKRKRSKASSSESESKSRAENGKGSNCDLVEEVTNEKLREKTGQNDAAVVTNMPSQSTVSRECNIPKESIVKKLTKGGFKETVVAKWDETEHSSSQITGRSTADVVIGYKGDDWDEEYDMGRRKKVRTSVADFGGPNPFQEVATQKAKFHRSSSANKPFRR